MKKVISVIIGFCLMLSTASVAFAEQPSVGGSVGGSIGGSVGGGGANIHMQGGAGVGGGAGGGTSGAKGTTGTSGKIRTKATTSPSPQMPRTGHGGASEQN